MFYPRPTVIYVLVFLPSALLFYKNTSISLSNITKPLLKTISLRINTSRFSFKLKIIPNYRSRCVSIRFLERIDSYPICLVLLSESERSNPSPYAEKTRFQWKQKTCPLWKLELSDGDLVWCKHSTRYFSFFHDVLVMQKKDLIKKLRSILKSMTSQPV